MRLGPDLRGVPATCAVQGRCCNGAHVQIGVNEGYLSIDGVRYFQTPVAEVNMFRLVIEPRSAGEVVHGKDVRLVRAGESSVWDVPPAEARCELGQLSGCQASRRHAFEPQELASV